MMNKKASMWSYGSPIPLNVVIDGVLKLLSNDAWCTIKESKGSSTPIFGASS